MRLTAVDEPGKAVSGYPPREGRLHSDQIKEYHQEWWKGLWKRSQPPLDFCYAPTTSRKWDFLLQTIHLGVHSFVETPICARKSTDIGSSRWLNLCRKPPSRADTRTWLWLEKKQKTFTTAFRILLGLGWVILSQSLCQLAPKNFVIASVLTIFQDFTEHACTESTKNAIKCHKSNDSMVYHFYSLLLHL